MLKKIIIGTAILGLSCMNVNAETYDLKDTERLAWGAYSLRYSNERFQPKINESALKWYMMSYHSEEYKKLSAGDDEFALHDLVEKSKQELDTKLHTLAFKREGSYIVDTFTFETSGKIGKYDFDEEGFTITPEGGEDIVNGRFGFTHVGNKLPGKIAIYRGLTIPNHYLKMSQEEAKKLIKKFKDAGKKDKTVQLKYSSNKVLISSDAWPRGYDRPWFILSPSMKDSQVEVIDIDTKEVIGIAKQKPRR